MVQLVDTVWANGLWTDTVWASGVWGDAGEVTPPVVVETPTGGFAADYRYLDTAIKQPKRDKKRKKKAKTVRTVVLDGAEFVEPIVSDRPAIDILGNLLAPVQFSPFYSPVFNTITVPPTEEDDIEILLLTS